LARFDLRCGHGTDGAIVQLRDGSSVRVRPPAAGDADSIREFLGFLSLESRRLRFFSSACDLEGAALWAASVDGTDHIGLIAVDPSGTIIGHAACARLYGLRGEVVVEVGEDHRQLGLGSVLLRQLARAAARQGIRTLVAEVRLEDHDMLAVFDDEFHAGRDNVTRQVEVDLPSAVWESAPAHRA
jgi:L-amino acid N-acyltransferase YncA